VSGSRVLVAVRVKADPLRAFEVFTGEIAEWWRPNEMFRFTPRSPGIVSFEGGEGGRFAETLPNGKVFEVGEVKVWRPGERLVFGWRCAWFEDGMATEVEVIFEPVGEGETRVSVTHSGWDSVPVANASRHGFPNTVFLQREAEWWTNMLASVKSRAPQDLTS
jgi:uncharacterized protein YndB with AHSA1/START domain